MLGSVQSRGAKCSRRVIISRFRLHTAVVVVYHGVNSPYSEPALIQGLLVYLFMLLFSCLFNAHFILFL